LAWNNANAVITQETAELEAKAYELEQKTAVAAEAKNVLDSWVRYEGQVKARQQKELADAVIAKINKELENPKVLDQILKQSVADIESMSAFDPVQRWPILLTFTRDCCAEVEAKTAGRSSRGDVEAPLCCVNRYYHFLASLLRPFLIAQLSPRAILIAGFEKKQIVGFGIEREVCGTL